MTEESTVTIRVRTVKAFPRRNHAAMSSGRLTRDVYKRQLPLLNDKEAAVYRRGRNAHTARTDGAYHKATGLEALFGYLYLSGETARLHVLFDEAMSAIEET